MADDADAEKKVTWPSPYNVKTLRVLNKVYSKLLLGGSLTHFA